MFSEILQPKEKKVEYIELIYDLIFVYMIGRNSQLLHVFDNGFVAWPAFLGYVMATLAVIQIWNFTTYYINVYGKHDVREHVFLFINMFLLYFMGEGTRTDWQEYHTQYHVAWALILINIGVQYLIEYRNNRGREENSRQIVRMTAILFIEAAIALCDIPFFKATQTTWISLAAILFGMGMVIFYGQKKSADFVDFPHLSERAMLYVVFTFGEMIIAIASYFEGEFSLMNTYYALMAFLIVVGLFLSYGVYYDHIIDRDKKTNGLVYILLHIFIIFSLNNITAGLELMRDEEVSLLPKMIFLIVSFVMYFGFLFGLGYGHAKAICSKYTKHSMYAALIGVAFICLMIPLRSQMMINIALSVVYVFAMFALIYKYGRALSGLE